ncbi:hypothetical protein HispidOSU_022472, partial [Sigmodon hispidus]
WSCSEMTGEINELLNVFMHKNHNSRWAPLRLDSRELGLEHCASRSSEKDAPCLFQ